MSMVLDLPVTPQSYGIKEHMVMQPGICNLSQVHNELQSLHFVEEKVDSLRSMLSKHFPFGVTIQIIRIPEEDV